MENELTGPAKGKAEVIGGESLNDRTWEDAERDGSADESISEPLLVLPCLPLGWRRSLSLEDMTAKSTFG